MRLYSLRATNTCTIGQILIWDVEKLKSTVIQSWQEHAIGNFNLRINLLSPFPSRLLCVLRRAANSCNFLQLKTPLNIFSPTCFALPRMNYKTLSKHALAARRFSYSPYSHFRVGAALLTSTGRVYTGCNIENSSYGLTICAERTALFKAISEGHKKFKALAIASDENGFTPPCGACRQVIIDLAGNIDVILTKKNGETEIIKMKELLPHAFTKRNLDRFKRPRR